jgi:glutathione S-transferase
MELYFSPLACSMATRIALYEAGAAASFTRVDTKAKRTADGADFLAINPMGQVPALRTDEGELLTENAAVLQYVADRFPAAALAPAGGTERYRLQEWLSFIGTELHKAVFVPLLDRTSPDSAKEYARQKAGPRLAHLEKYLNGREYLLDRFSVADAYLATVLTWAKPSGVELSEWPTIQAYLRRMLTRPSIAKAFAEERALYQAR